MKQDSPKYFDYLESYAPALELTLAYVGLRNQIIDSLRCLETTPAIAGNACRTIAEAYCVHYLTIGGFNACTKKGKPKKNLESLIKDIETKGLLEEKLICKLTEIRKQGNIASHYSKIPQFQTRNAVAALKLLDDLLRALIRKEIDPSIVEEVPPGSDSMFKERLVRDAQIASTLANDPSISAEAKIIDRETSTLYRMISQQTDEMIRAIFDSIALADADTLDTVTENLDDFTISSIFQKITELDRRRITLRERVDCILKEHDIIAHLLGGDATATSEQLRVMAFPKKSDAKSTTLRLRGEAGTGKTLCLIAKLIQEVCNPIQTNSDDAANRKRNALFLCFNKDLRNYIRDLVARYPEASDRIEVESIDKYVNQLVRESPDKEFSHLRQYAQDVRYPLAFVDENGRKQYWKIVYGKDHERFIKTAMEQVASAHPEVGKGDYFDASQSDNVSWMRSEIEWAEGRFGSLENARNQYPNAARVGRGGSRRPKKDSRSIILEIWSETNKLLAKNHAYTYGQAVQKLLSSSELPEYDAIAIDEAQDLSRFSIFFAMMLKRKPESHVFLAADEEQKIYDRDFTWKGLRVSGTTITLTENLRNSPSIRYFAGRLQGRDCTFEEASEGVRVEHVDNARIEEIVQSLSESPDEETLVIGADSELKKSIRKGPLNTLNSGSANSKVSFSAPLSVKGVEADNVIVIYDREARADDEDTEKRIRYVNFTRARKRLYVCYRSETPPKLLQRYYADFLEKLNCNRRSNTARLSATVAVSHAKMAR